MLTLTRKMFTKNAILLTVSAMLSACTQIDEYQPCGAELLNSLSSRDNSQFNQRTYEGPFKYSSEGIRIVGYEEDGMIKHIHATIFGETLKGEVKISFVDDQSYIYESETNYYHTWDDETKTRLVCNGKPLGPSEYDFEQLQDYVNQIRSLLDIDKS